MILTLFYAVRICPKANVQGLCILFLKGRPIIEWFDYPDQLLQFEFYTILTSSNPKVHRSTHTMKELSTKRVKIQGGFWEPRLEMNAQAAIYHQWEQLEKTGCIENFRLIADKKEGIRIGFFFADSDAFKWLDAASRVYVSYPSDELKSLMDGFIDIIGRTQSEDGYIYTYNQYFFPDVRWSNLQIEHELYCHGHLIEAAVSHYQATGECTLLDIAIKAADLLVRAFTHAGPQGTPGHQEIEIALIRLYRITNNKAYLDLAEHFIENRGRIKPFITHILGINRDIKRRSVLVAQRQEQYATSHPEHGRKFKLPGDNISIKPPFGKQRWFFNMASGKYFQQHKPVREQTVPAGHAVRFAYLETAIAMLYRELGDETQRRTLEAAWNHMVSRRMYVTGGIGALPNIEGFGRDYELDPLYSYSETCAALGVIFWNREMSLITGEAKYADLTEWQLYNGAAVGLGQDGTSYLYNNPLVCHGDVLRQAWFKCPCCPSNVSRAWADLGRYIYSYEAEAIWVHQYISSQTSDDLGFEIRMETGFPWYGKVNITLTQESSQQRTVYLRIPSWSEGIVVRVNGEPISVPDQKAPAWRQTASGYDPYLSWYLPLERTWSPKDVIEIELGMNIHIRATHPRVRATRGQVAISRGPLVYCLESIDNPEIDIFNAVLDPASLNTSFSKDHFDGICLICGQTVDGLPLTFIPYYLWANRGESKMTVYIKAGSI